MQHRHPAAEEIRATIAQIRTDLQAQGENRATLASTLAKLIDLAAHKT
ncbi:hypothetical protein D554_2148 [Bordetella holmesii 30539]|uniref:Uncharacterized protein n=2 Tax=Bordetella holmesii TaxID=35814 RepID=A0A158M0R8_9BORD|nr:hypothetical protein D560_0555 [Bordetella holmesii ATCC 51541]AIT25235.1 hypothetical protein D558_0546 [Bordetella holmesii 44057]EWM45799.1 hypothetical protein D557_3807 [Bordetella holmesii 70147]EWM48410.1 hypothetical protein D556_0550 [Bordetella holmesii 41130]EWM49929.1 hypothetical protein D555_0557 [Bordetella holmesii 35009]EXF86895.1 hypothetical protein D554_2148 [Bordetella holmesii 30539]EXX95080.1 hypothetical protein D559_2507 [Bordetella holmesii 1058]KAK82281.1 hypoth